MSCIYEGRHKGKVSSWRLWRDGDTEAVAVDVCVSHAEDLLELMRVGETVPLPARPRITIKPTKLKTIPATAHLKLPG